MNSDLDDIATMLTDSLSRSGSGGMQTTLSLALTGFSYGSDPDTGMSRSAANTQVITVGGSNYTFTTTDVTAPGGASLLPLVGEIRMWALPTAPTGWIFMRGQACTTTYPLWRAALIAASNPYGTSGGDPLFPDMRCVVPAGLDVGARGLLTGSTTLGNTIGHQSEVIAKANLPNYQLPNTLAISDPGHIHAVGNPGNLFLTQVGAGGIATLSGAALNISNAGNTNSATTGVSITGDIALDGAGTALPVVQPTVIINYIGRAA